MIGRPVIRLDSVSSTQDVAFLLAERGASEGTVVLTRHQRAGRGRAGRAWTDQPGDALLFSVILRPQISPGRLAPFSILLADAIAETIGSRYGLDAEVKWPNDVLINGRKLSGVLIQSRNGVAVAGIGINVRAPETRLPQGATSLFIETRRHQDADALLAALLSAIDARYADTLSGDMGEAIRRINARLYLRGEQVTIKDGAWERRGQVVRVRDDGALLLKTGHSDEVIVSGEMVRGPRPIRP
jgi:BirA family transcriptional regulator, biotin operon repressor / biotin---[acetyl-CoA-carboxylase] ligase